MGFYVKVVFRALFEQPYFGEMRFIYDQTKSLSGTKATQHIQFLQIPFKNLYVTINMALRGYSYTILWLFASANSGRGS